MSEQCEHDRDDGERYNSPYSAGYCIIEYVYTCKKCGKEEIYEKDVS